MFNTEYKRVIPRDLFNESKILKCMGRLCLLIHDGLAPASLSFKHDGSEFEIVQMIDGELTISNLEIRIFNILITFKTIYNDKANYPLYAEYGEEDHLVFNGDGSFAKEFLSLIHQLTKSF